MKLRKSLILGAAVAFIAIGCGKKEEKAVLTHAPEVPPQLNRSGNAKVTIELETKEIKKHDIFSHYSIAAAQQAWDDAKLQNAGIDPRRACAAG